MKYLLVTAAIIAGSSSLAHSRTAELLSFGPTRSSGFGSANEKQGEATASVDDALAEFAASNVPVSADQPEPPPPTAGLRIPSWMKGRGKASRFFASVTSASAAFPAVAQGCTWEPYRPNPRLSSSTEQRRARYYGLVAAAACESGVPTHLLDALVTQESRYNPAARSPVGAMGLAQLMPGTARQLGVGNPWDVVDNLRGGARYLRAQLDEFKRYDLALGAYNAGPARVRRTGRVPYIRETLGYVSNILQDVRWSLGQGPRVAVAESGFVPSSPIRTALLAQF